MIVCPSCGSRNEDDEQFCGECGNYLDWDEVQVVEEPAAVELAELEMERGRFDRAVVAATRAIRLDECRD
ncbi:zinc ribbon domain-containing protein, partial [Cellulomonas fimi]|uniref:zinc-ribbon domain-containing protein n=1 Tax=Cellulomonas fimi TaxID=1708 RepID=UPI00234C6489